MHEPLFHIASLPAWAGATDVYVPADFATDGFIHCSTARQVLRIASAFFASRSDLVLLMIDPRRVAAPILHENLEGGAEPFPHIYGPLPKAAVVTVEPLRLRDDGAFDPACLERCLTRWA